MTYRAAAAITFAAQLIGRGRYGNGQCWTLVEDAIVGAGGQSSRTLTRNFGPHSNYVWGTPVMASNVAPGDVLQFRGYSWTRSITRSSGPTTNALGSARTDTEPSQTRSHHSAIIVRVIGAGLVEVVEQNVPVGSVPRRTILGIVGGTQPPEDTVTTDMMGTYVTRRVIVDTVRNPPLIYRPV
jgi:hypothetical protein